MIPRSLLGAIWLPILLLQTLAVPFTKAEEAIITLLENPAWSYRAELADFGYILDQRLRYNANFMTPPLNETQLCSFPSFTLSDLDRASKLSKPVALLVSLGGCGTGQKVEVALEIHKKITNFLRFIVFYNNDPNNPDEIFKVNPPANTTLFEKDLEEMSFSAISTGTSSAILAHIDQFSTVSGKSSDFLGPSSEGWMLEMIIETAANPYINNRTTSDQIGASNFYWFRIVLFALLVLSPFCRAIFLWWTGGGRIRLRRNENGRIVGFLYTPPMAYWFVSHGTQEAEPVADTMTTEQVMDLPEIVYKPPPSEDTAKTGMTTDVSTTDDSDDNNDAMDKPPGAEEDVDDGCLIRIVDRTSANLTSTLQPTEISTEEGSPTTTCSTACPICIDDFEAGEKIRLLPCGHAFHTECILPWLTRRQGCCPMCKKSVMGGDDDDEETNRAVETTPFSRCLENYSGVETMEESGGTRSMDRGDTNTPRGSNEIARLDTLDGVDPEAQNHHVVDAVVNGFGDSPIYAVSNGIDFGADEDLIPSPDLATTPAEELSNVENDMLTEIEDSKADTERVESSRDDAATPNGMELPQQDIVPQSSDLSKQEAAEELPHSVEHEISESPIANDNDEVADQDEPTIAESNTPQSPTEDNDETTPTRPDSDIQDSHETAISDSILMEHSQMQECDFNEVSELPESGEDAPKETG